MKPRHALFATLMLSSLATPPLLADDAPEPDQTPGAAAPLSDQAIQKMPANTRRMQCQLEHRAKSNEPAQRPKLVQAHMLTMQENTMAGQPAMAGGGGA